MPQDLFGGAKRDWLKRAQRTAYNLLLERDTITIEHVLARCPRPAYLHNSITGRVFQNDVFVSVGYVTAKNPKSHGRVIRIWTFAEAFVPPEMLSRHRVRSEDI